MFNQVTIILRTSSWQKIPFGKLKEKSQSRRIYIGYQIKTTREKMGQRLKHCTHTNVAVEGRGCMSVRMFAQEEGGTGFGSQKCQERKLCKQL